MLFLLLMNFLFPTFLIGLVSIAIPIIIHLFNFRKYKKIQFTNVHFLKELKQESDSKSKLKEWLILATRILAITCLVFAFAQPFIPSKNKIVQGNKIISIYIDNSFSMENTNKKGTLLENAKQIATEIANTYNASDKFQLLSNEFEGKQQRLLAKEEFIEQLNDLKICPVTQDLKNVIKRQQDFLKNNNSKNKQLFILSDFQKNISNFSKSDIDTAIISHLIPLTSSELKNVYVDSIWFENPIQQYNTLQTIHAEIKNNGSKSIENASIKLIINNKQVSLNSFNVEANSKTSVSISFVVKENGINNGILKLEDYPITFDDEFYFCFNAKNIIKSLVINGTDSKTGGNFKSLMNNDSLFIYNENEETKIDYNLFTTTNLLILNNLKVISSGLTTEIDKLLNAGGSVIIFPNNDREFTDYNLAFQHLHLPQIIGIDTANTTTQSINFEQGLFEGVFEKIDSRMDLPKVFEHIIFKQTTNNAFEPIIMLQNGRPLLSKYNVGNGKIYLFSSSSKLESTNYIKHSLFVPTIIKIGVLSIKTAPTYYTITANQNIEIKNDIQYKDKPLHIVKDQTKFDIIPEQRLLNNITNLFTQNQIKEAGYYKITQENKEILSVAFNYNRNESQMDFLTNEELTSNIEKLNLKNITVLDSNKGTITNTLKETNNGSKLWKLFLILALLFLLSEILIIRLLKNN